MPKLTVAQREEIKHLIKLCKIKGLSLRETTERVNNYLPNECALSEVSIEKYITQLKAESKNWINQMAFDVYEFVYEVQERWDSLKELSRIQWKILEKAVEENNVDGQNKSSMLLCKINDQLLQMVMLLPQIAVPNSFAKVSLANKVTSESPMSAADYEIWRKDPTFAGMPGHSMNGDYTSRPYHDPDLERDQP